MTSIEYEDYELLSFFEKEPTTLFEGEWLEIITGCRKSYFLKKEPILAFVEGMAESNA